MWVEIWIHYIGWNTNFISLNSVNLSPLLNAGFLFVGCAIFSVKFLIHQFLPKLASILSLYPEYLCSECSLGYGALCVPWRLLPLLTCGNEEGIKIRSCLQTKKVLEKLCMPLLVGAASCCCIYGSRESENNLGRWALGACSFALRCRGFGSANFWGNPVPKM